MDGHECRRHVLMDDGAQENAGGEDPHQGAPRRKAAPRSTIPRCETRCASTEATTRLWVTTNSIAHAGVAVFDAIAGSAPLNPSITPPKPVYHATLDTDATSAAAAILR
jgi:hypothetical protein